jgi:uncharacterized repeat protein (TIGR01451 family)
VAGLLALVVFCLLGSPAESKRTTIAPPASADLSMSKTGPSSANVNSSFSYTITITNSGPDTATNASWSDALPSSLLFLSINQNTGPSMTCTTPDPGSNGTITCSIASLPVGSAQFTVNVLIANNAVAGSTITNIATAASSTFDSNSGNNSGIANTTALAPSLLSGLKSVSGPKTPGSTITYEITISNSGASDQQDNPGNEFTDVLPSQLTLVSADASGGTASANIGTNTATWNGTIPSGDAVTVIITATIKAGTEGVAVSNQGTINYDADGNGTNEATTQTDDPSTSGADATVFTVCAATHVVTTNADTGAGSLRQAIADACPGTSITFSGVTSPITLSSGEIVIDKDLTITGPNAGLTISGNNSSRIFRVQNGNTVSISNLTFTGGSASVGGAIFDKGDLTIRNCTFTGNKAVGSGGAGGAIDSEGGSSAGSLTVINTTISGNNADGDGGGIFNTGNSTALLTNVTITNNVADANADNEGLGGGLAQLSSSNLTLNNTIIAGNFRASGEAVIPSGPAGEPTNNPSVGTKDDVYVQADNPATPSDIDPSPLDASSSNNLIGVDTGLTPDISNGVNGNQIGTAASPIDPKLLALANNGGPTQTHLLLPNSPALNAGNTSLALDNGSPLTTDQRGSGFPRVVGSSVDIGSVEANYTITATAGTPQSAAINTLFSTALKATVKESNVAVGGVSVTFTAPASGASGSFSGSSTVTTDGSGVATAPAFTANSIAGIYNVTATLVGTSLTTTFSLKNTASTATAVSSSLNPSLLGQSVTFTATVTSAGGTPTGTVQFKDGVNNLGSPVTLNGSGQATLTTSSLTAGTHTISAVYSGDTLFGGSTGTLSPDQSVTNRPLIKFSQPNYSVNENGKFITITVTRSGDTGPAVTVDYTTPDDSAATSVLPCATPGGVAIPRCDFTTALGTLAFASGQTSNTFTVLISQDAFLEGNETFTLTLSNPTGGAGFAQPSDSSATVTIIEDETTDSLTPDDTEDFVRQHYHDFLNREPDPAGLAFWMDNINKCQDLTRRPPTLSLNQCIETFRVDTSAAFFLSIEFQNTGYFVERIYKTAFGDINPPSIPVPVRFTNFIRDSQDVRGNIIVGQGAWQAQLDNNKSAFALAFVQRSAFLTKYPGSTSATAFVDTLNGNAGNVLTGAERSALIAELSPNPSDPALRASVLRKIADNALFQQQETNRAFVLMEYFGYLRRNPDAGPEAGLNFNGYNFWLNKLNSFNGDYKAAEMVKAFLNSAEYRHRFGQ